VRTTDGVETLSGQRAAAGRELIRIERVHQPEPGEPALAVVERAVPVLIAGHQAAAAHVIDRLEAVDDHEWCGNSVRHGWSLCLSRR
jgi:hypothetical protein